MFIFERQMAWGSGRDATQSCLHSVSNGRSEGLNKEMGRPLASWWQPGWGKWSIGKDTTHLGLVLVSINSRRVGQSSLSLWIWRAGRETMFSILPAVCLWLLFFTAVPRCLNIWEDSTPVCPTKWAEGWIPLIPSFVSLVAKMVSEYGPVCQH